MLDIGGMLAAIGLGMAATITPCILPLYPAFIAYLTGAQATAAGPGRGGAGTIREARPFPPLAAAILVWAGVVSGMMAIGAAFALLARPLGDFNRIVLPLADGLLIALGLLLIVGRNPFARLPQLSTTVASGRGPASSAYLYGLIFAPIAVPCSGPFIIAIFAFSLTIGDVFSQLAFFLAFGIGFGLPLFVIGLLGQLRGAQLARALSRWERPLQISLGLLLVAVGIWDLGSNIDLILGP